MAINVVIKEVGNEISKTFLKRVEIKRVENLGGGCINNAAKLETNMGDFFLKWNANVAADTFIKEAEGLHELKKAAANKLIIPEVYATKKVDATPGFLVLEYLEPGYHNQNYDEMLGRGLAHIHRYTAENFGFYSDNYCGSTPQNNGHKKSWIDFFRENRLGFLIQLIKKQRGIDASEIKILDKLIEKLPQLIPQSDEPSLIHGDLWSGNYMFTTRGAALIDPAVYYAHREMEFGIITMFGGFSSVFFDAYNEVFPLLEDWRQRNALYQLYHILNHYYLFGGAYKSQALRVAKSYL